MVIIIFNLISQNQYDENRIHNNYMNNEHAFSSAVHLLSSQNSKLKFYISSFEILL